MHVSGSSRRELYIDIEHHIDSYVVSAASFVTRRLTLLGCLTCESCVCLCVSDYVSI